MPIESPYGDYLPIFPTFYDNPTEDRIERVAERLTDRADKAFLAGLATQAQYDAWNKALDRWCGENYRIAWAVRS